MIEQTSYRKYIALISAAAVIGVAVGAAVVFTHTSDKTVTTVTRPAVTTTAPPKTEQTAQIPAGLLPDNSVVAHIYDAFGNRPLWQGRQAKARLKSLDEAAALADAHGIDTQKLRAAMAGVSADPRSDVALTQEVADLFKDMRIGVVDFSDAAGYWKIPAESYDPTADVTAAIREFRLAQALKAQAPTHPDYGELLKSLATYRKFAENGGWKTIPADTEVLLDKPDARISLVKERLAAEGYDVGNDDAFKASIAAFQEKNGLASDSRLGKTTLAALNVSADARAEQIAVNLERWRHVPRDFKPDYVMVNTADGAVTLMRDGVRKLHFRAITGDRRHPTPVLVSRITAVTFNPTWEIPISIARKEILPKLKQDPTYLKANNMVVVNGSADDPHGLYMNWERFDGKSLPYRLRQQPGAINSLGFLKFEMSNPYNIYLHDTPSRNLFDKPDRHLSHGCVRVENPRQLAQEVLAPLGKWDSDAIDAAIATGRTQRVMLETWLPVYVMYWTAYMDDGKVQFRSDAYHRDEAIAQGLHENAKQTRPAVVQASRALREEEKTFSP